MTKKGLTLPEVLVTTMIFFSFMGILYSILDFGFKSWHIGETRSEIQQAGEVAMKRLMTELLTSTIYTVTINDPNYISFETAVNPSDNEFKRDSSGIPLWQGHVIYFTLIDPDTGFRNLYRAYAPRTTPGSMPQTFTDLDINPYCTKSKGKLLAKELESLSFVKKNNIITVTFLYRKKVRSNAVVVFHNSADKGIERFEIKSSVEPRN